MDYSVDETFYLEKMILKMKRIIILSVFLMLMMCGCGGRTDSTAMMPNEVYYRQTSETMQSKEDIAKAVNNQEGITEPESLPDLPDSVQEKSVLNGHEIDISPIHGEWHNDTYGHLYASILFNESGGMKTLTFSYEAPNDDLENLYYVCCAMDTFMKLGEGSKATLIFWAALPGDDKPYLSFSDKAGLSASELDGSASYYQLPSWVSEYNVFDQDLYQWVLDCYGECIDELRIRNEKLGEIINEPLK